MSQASGYAQHPEADVFQSRMLLYSKLLLCFARVRTNERVCLRMYRYAYVSVTTSFHMARFPDGCLRTRLPPVARKTARKHAHSVCLDAQPLSANFREA